MNAAKRNECMLDPLVVLFVRDQSIYKVMGLDCYDRQRDARTFAGHGPVIAHPPCRTWGALRHRVPKRPAEHALGPWAVEQVRRCGGVLEHPKRSTLFEHCGCGSTGDVGFVLTVDQYHWGHRAAKPTRLYVVGCEPADVPAMPHREGEPTHCITQGHGVRIGHPRFKSRVPQWEREATPPAFAAWLVELARRCSKHNAEVSHGVSPLAPLSGSGPFPAPKNKSHKMRK